MSTNEELWVRCECGHVWIAAHLPMEVRKMARLVDHLHCPKCAGPSSHIFLASAADLAALPAPPEEIVHGPANPPAQP